MEALFHLDCHTDHGLSALRICGTPCALNRLGTRCAHVQMRSCDMLNYGGRKVYVDYAPAVLADTEFSKYHCRRKRTSTPQSRLSIPSSRSTAAGVKANVYAPTKSSQTTRTLYASSRPDEAIGKLHKHAALFFMSRPNTLKRDPPILLPAWFQPDSHTNAPSTAISSIRPKHSALPVHHQAFVLPR
jgi:hypothetical protein